jgi:hypothetical protein
MMYGGKRFRDGSALMIVLAGASAIAMMHAGCGGSDTPTSPSGSGGTGGSGGNGSGAYTPGMTNSSTGTGGSGTGASTTTSSEDGGSTPGTGGAGGSTSSTTTTGLGGFGGAAAWPDCSSDPNNTMGRTINQIWQADTAMPLSMPLPVWLTNVYVTGVSGGGCVDGTACQIFLQQDASYATLHDAEQQGINLFASKRTSMHFTGVAVGDKLNVYGQARRSTQNGQNELLIEVTLATPGCFAKLSGNNAITPVALTDLEDIVKENYEKVGPLFVDVTSNPKIHGKPKMPAETFGIIDSSLDLEAGTDQLISLSPTFLASSAFTGLTTGMTTHFDHVTGIYGLFVPPGQSAPVTKYKEIYVRAVSDYPHD